MVQKYILVLEEKQMSYKRRNKYVPPEMYESWGGEFAPKRYKVKYKETWVTPRKAAVVGESLHYELFDSTQGVAKPHEWYEEGKPKKPICCGLLGDSKPSTTMIVKEDYPKHQSDWEDKETKKALDVMAKEGMVSKDDEDDDNILEI